MRTCSNDHPVPDGASFCPTCGVAMHLSSDETTGPASQGIHPAGRAAVGVLKRAATVYLAIGLVFAGIGFCGMRFAQHAGSDSAQSIRNDAKTSPGPSSASAAPTVDSKTPSEPPPRADVSASSDTKCPAGSETQSTLCAEKAALIKDCGPTSYVALRSDSRGLLTWTYFGPGKTRLAFTSGSTPMNATAESCGEPTNGIDVRNLHNAIAIYARANFGFTPTTIRCGDIGQVDTVSLGGTTSCAVALNGREQGIWLQVTDTAPYFALSPETGD